MQAEHHKYLPECTDKEAGHHWADVVDSHSRRAHNLACPGCHRADSQKGQRHYDENSEKRSQKAFEHGGHSRSHGLFYLGAEPYSHHDGNNAGGVIHQDNRQTEQFHMNGRLENRAFKERIEGVALHDGRNRRIDECRTNRHTRKLIHLELAGGGKAKENRQEIEEHIP